MRIISLFFLAALILFPAAQGSAQEGSTRVRALLVVASNQAGKPDARLSAYAPTLRRILRFENYRLAGEGSAALSGGETANVSLGQGHVLQLGAEKGERAGARLRVRWQEGDKTLMNTGLSLRPGVPAVLGGPSTGTEGQVWAVILIAD